MQNFVETIENFRSEQMQLADLYLKKREEVEKFVSYIKSAAKLNNQNRQAGYIDNADNYKSDLSNRMAEVRKDAKGLETVADWCSLIENSVNNVVRYRSNVNSYDASPEEKQNRQNYLYYYATYLHAIVGYLLVKESTGTQKFMSVIQEDIDSLVGDAEKQYLAAESSVKGELKTAKTNRVGGSISPLTEEVAIPKDFPEEAGLVFGKYSSAFDIDDGNVFYKEEKIVNKECVAPLKELQEELKKLELKYKRLIYALVSANRSSDVFSLDFSSPSENNHIVIHQPRYSEMENKDIAVIELFESAICRYMNLFPKTSKRIAVIQKRALSELAPFVQNITVENKYKELVFTGDEKSDEVVCENAEYLLSALLSECRAIDAMLGMTESRNLFEYNRTNYQNGVWKQMTLLFIKDFPLGFNERALELFKNILGKANKLGIYVVMTVCNDLVSAIKEKQPSFDIDGVFSYFGNSFDICVNEDGGYTHSMISRFSYEKVNFGDYSLKSDKFRREKYFKDLEERMLAANDPAIPLQSLFEGGIKNTKIAQDNRRSDFFKVLSFPIGKVGTRQYNMELYQSGGGSPHVVIAGTTGSGKSVLLHDIILSAMCMYTPEELELYLFDFKETAEGFDIYERNFPHVKKVAMECKDKEILELLTMIKKTYVDRMQKVKNFMKEHPEEKSVSNIIEYNRYARANGLKQIPRMIVVIDEYQTITSEANLALLLEIAQKGREYGVVLIMASQSSNVSAFGNIIKLFGQRFEFKNEPIGALISRASSRAQELLGPKGLCFYSPDGSAGIPVLLRCAFVNKNTDLPEFINYVNKKYGGKYPVTTYKIGSVKRIVRANDYSAVKGFTTLEQRAKAGEEVFDGEAESCAEWQDAAAQKFVSADDLQNKGYVLNLGLNSISLAQFVYVLDKKSPYLIAFGDSGRIESLFYSAAKSALLSAAAANAPVKDSLVYLLNGKEGFAESSAVCALKGAKGVTFAENKSAAADVIDALYTELQSRKTRSDRTYAPIIVIISEFNSFINLLGLESDSKQLSTASVAKDDQKVSTIAQGFEAKFGNLFGGMNIGPAPEANKEQKPAEQKISGDISAKFNKLLSSEGGEYGFFFCLQISDSSKNSYLKKRLETTKLYSVVYLDSYTNGSMYNSDNDGVEQIGSFINVFLPERRVKIGVNDIKAEYAYRFTTNKTVEFIPYEYTPKK